MEDKLVTLAILTYAKAQILKNVLENEGIETYIHNVNQIQPVVSSGVRVRIKESDLPHALKITESSAWLSEEDVFNYQLSDEENVRSILQKVHADLNALSDKVKEKVASGEFPDIKYTCVLREGIPEEEVLRYTKEYRPRIIIMGTRGKSQKDIDLIGSVTAEVIERSRVPVLAIPENTPFKQFSEAKRIAFITNFDQRDLIAFDSLINNLKSFKFSVSLIHLSDVQNTWNEIKLAGIKEYFQKQYPQLEIYYDVVKNDNLLSSLDSYIKSNHIDIITLTSYKRNIFSRLFNPGIARKMIFHSDTPLLVIYGRPN